MNSVEDVYNYLLQEKRNNDIKIALSDNKELIEITLSPNKHIIADDDMVEINRKKRFYMMEYWTATHWHPTTFEDLYEDLMKYIT